MHALRDHPAETVHRGVAVAHKVRSHKGEAGLWCLGPMDFRV
jgi:hypothetical protein